MGAGAAGNRPDADRPTRQAVDAQILPTLRWAAGPNGPADGDAVAAALIALGKTAHDPADVDLLLAIVDRRGAKDLVREGAAVALGLLRRTTPGDAFDGKALDRVRARLLEVVDEEEAPTRTRCFAALSVGLLGDQPCDPNDPFAKAGRLAVRGLWTRIGSGLGAASEELPVALLVALSLQPREGVPGAVLDGLRAACLSGRLLGRTLGRLTRAHAALALARLGDAESTGLFLGIARARHHDAALRRSAVAALGVLAPRLDAALRALAAEGLAEVARTGDPDTAGLALVTVGRLVDADFEAGSVEAVRRTGDLRSLLRTAETGTFALRPFAAMALALAVRSGGACAETRDFLVLREKAYAALRAPLEEDGTDPDTRGAFALALGLLGDARALPLLVSTAGRRGSDPGLRADACAGIGLLGRRVPEALAVLRASLEERADDDLRREAARALGVLGDVSAVPALLHEVTSGAPDHVLARAAVALGAIGDVSAVLPLVAIARSRSTADTARAVSLAALGLLGDLEPVRSLARLAVDSNYLARTDALNEALSLL